MAEKRILIADADVKTVDEFRRAMGASWIVIGATTGNAAMAEAQKQTFDVVVANFDLPGLGGAEMLNRMRVINPKSIRFIAAAETVKEKVMCHVLGGHQFMAVPFDPTTIKSSIERSLAADYGMTSSMRELVGRIRTFPTIPSLYMEVVNALKDPNSSTEDIGAIIAKDMAMTTKLVQVLNSAYFGLSRTITDPTEAVGILGFETVKSLIMTIKVLSQYDKVKPVYFSIDNIWRHSTNVARTARVMALLEIGDNDCSATAYTAGLMHDLGKVILAANFDGQYHGAHAVARKQQIPLWEVEKDIFGATHGEIGAYLLGLWGMSPEVVRVAALHHYPLRSGDESFTALTAVHVANALENEDNPDNDGLPPALVDVAYLKHLGLEERFALWRDARSEPDATKFETKMQRAKSMAKPAAKPVHPAPIAAPQAVKFAPAAAPPQELALQALRNWLGVGLGVTAVLVFLALLAIMRLAVVTETHQVLETANDRPAPAGHVIATIIPPALTVEATKPAAMPPTHLAPVAALDATNFPSAPQTNAASVPSVEATKPPLTAPANAASVPTVEATRIEPASPTNLASVTAVQQPTSALPAPARTGFDRLKLQGIFFTAEHPAALISGQLASVDQEVAGCRVLSISPSSVIVEYQHQRKTLTLR
jgi:HD-like signal output (HDOD) protein